MLERIESSLSRIKFIFHGEGDSTILSGPSLAQQISLRKLDFERSADSQIQVFVDSTPESTLALIAALLCSKPVIVREATLAPSVAEEQEKFLRYQLHPDCKLVLFTSGSLAAPKAIQLSLKNIDAAIEALLPVLPFQKSTHQNLLLPLSYSFGLLGQFLPALVAGLETNFFKDFLAAKRHWSQNGLHGMWSGLPLHAQAWLRDEAKGPSKDLQLIFAGQALSGHVRQELQNKFPGAFLSVNYGLTEGSSRVLSANNSDGHFFSDFSGRPVGLWQTRLNSKQELEVHGPQQMLGFLGATPSPFTKDGWLETHDLATGDHQSGYTIQGRSDTLRFLGGQKIDLSLLEKEIASALKGAEILCRISSEEGHDFLTIFIENSPENRNSTETLILDRLGVLGIAHKSRLRILLQELPRLKNGKLDRRG